MHSTFLSDFQQVCHNYADENLKLRQELQTQQDTIQGLQDNIAKLEETVKILDQEAETQNKKILELRNHLRSASQEINFLRETPGNSDSMRRSTSNVPTSFDPAVSLFGDSPRNTGTLKRSGSANSLPVTGGSVNGNNNNANSPHMGRLRKSASKSNFQFDDYNSVDPSAITKTVTTQSPVRGTMALASPVQWLHSFREDVQRAMDDGRCRSITLKECKDLIAQIYESKAVANEKALQGVGNVPMETMEQHAFRILEKKYGLRSLAVGHAGMLLKALETYALEDNEVSVFQKIFRNEIEEDFRFVQQELLKSIRELTMVQIMGRNPLKDSTHLQQLLETKMNSGCIYEDEWKDMINYLYNNSDATTLGVLLKRQALLERDDSPAITATTEAVQETTHMLPGNTVIPHKVTRANATYVVGTPNATYHTQDAYQSGQLGYDKSNPRDSKRLGYVSPTLKIQIKDPNQQKLSRRDYLKLSFPVFVKIVLDFQLRSHMEYLATFLHLFKQFDANVDGVLSGAEFKDFFHVLYHNTPRSPQAVEQMMDNEEEEELKSLLTLVKLIDPHQHDRFVFSSAVICLQKLQ